MRERWKIIAGFAVLGFAVAACIYVLNTYHDYTKPFGPLEVVSGLVNMILCPPVLLFLWCIDCEYGTAAGLEVNLLMVGLLNAALYAGIAMAFVLRRERSLSVADPAAGGFAESSTSAGRPLPRVPAQEKRQRWFEVCLVLLLACGGFVLNGIYLLKNGPGAMPGISNLRWSVGIVQEAGCLMLVGYVLSRRRLKFANLGLRWSLRGVGVGLLVAMISYLVYGIGSVLIQVVYRQMFGHMASSPRPNQFFGHPPLMFIPFSLLNPFFEELIIRAYLMTEVAELTESSALAVVVSVAVQFSYHLYYGWIGAISVSFLFLVFALYYVRARQALPVIVAHGLFDVYALIRLW